jgi:glycosyltransferase involved in cell wall biosynthesis
MAGRDPKVSVIVPAYNSAAYTVETVESVLGQTYRDFELIVVDDGSTDNTREAMERFGDQIQYVYKENGGACSTRNMGIGMARGEYVACLDCDDLWLPEKLQRSVEALDAHSDWGLVFNHCYLIDAAGEIVGLTNYKFKLQNPYRELLHDNFIGSPTILMRRSCLDQVGLYDENIFIPADWDLWIRIAAEYSIGYLDEPLSKYRMASRYTLRHIEQSIEENLYVLDKHFARDSSLSAREKEVILSRFYVEHGKLYREAAELAKARSKLKAAIRLNPRFWPSYAHLGLSYLGPGVWRYADRLKDFVWGGWAQWDASPPQRRNT